MARPDKPAILISLDGCLLILIAEDTHNLSAWQKLCTRIVYDQQQKCVVLTFLLLSIYFQEHNVGHNQRKFRQCSMGRK
jgi:hypothetical protein